MLKFLAILFFLSLASCASSQKVEQSDLHQRMGLSLYDQGNYPMALREFLAAEKLNPNSPVVQNNLGRILIEVGKYKDAEKELMLALNDLTYSGQDRIYLNLGLVFFNQNQFEKARDNFVKSVNLQRDSCTGHSFLGRSYFELKKYEKAAEVLDNAIGYCQKNFFDEPHYYSALTYYRLGQVEKATARFQEIMKLYQQGQYRDKARAMLELLQKGQ